MIVVLLILGIDDTSQHMHIYFASQIHRAQMCVISRISWHGIDFLDNHVGN